MTGAPLTVTLDTNVLIEYWKRQDKAAITERLLNLADEGYLDLAVTRRIEADIPRPPLADRVAELPELSISKGPSVTRIGHWRIGMDVLADDRFAEGIVSLCEDRCQGKPPDWRDQDHLHAHYLTRRDVFLTWDRGILRLAAGLRERFEIVVMPPEAFVAQFPNPDDGPRG